MLVVTDNPELLGVGFVAVHGKTNTSHSLVLLVKVQFTTPLLFVIPVTD